MAQKLPPHGVRRSRHGWHLGARENDPREHRLAREKAEEGEEDEARSPTRRRRTKTARNGGLRAEVTASRRRFLCARSRLGAEARRGELRRRRRRAALCPLLIRARSRGEDRGRGGAASAVSGREEIEATVGEGDEPDGWAPPVSRQRERGSRLGRGVLGQNGRKKEGGEKGFFLFIFQTIFFSNSFPNEFLNSNSFHQNHSSHKRNAPACMQQNISLTYI